MKTRAILVLALVTSLTGCSKSPEAQAIENAADALADNMEAQADAMDALANKTADVSRAEPKGNTAPETAWTYSESKDEMRGSTSKAANLSSTNTLQLSAPYGATNPVLTVRKDPKFGFNIFISSDGQPLCRSYNDDTLSVKFDNGPIREWSCSEAADGSPGIVFFDREQSFLAAIKKAKKMVVEVNYYDAGRQQITFPVAGLKW